ncbi:hypothetical protein O4H61_08600 [Roseovarius aestuarii]|nr:hypothetical protein [Roseovarius aestuarii]
MSTWTCKLRRTAFLALTLGLILPLAGCFAPGGDGRMSLLQTPSGKPSDALRRVSLYHGEVIATGPDGYCVDPKSVRRQGGSSFVLLASCGHLSETAASDVPTAVITVSVLPRDTRAKQPSAAQMAAALKDSGVDAQIDGDGLSMVHVTRGGDRVVPGSDPRHWRATMMINGHMVGLAVYASPQGPATGRAGRDVLIAVAEAMLEASPLKRPKGAPAVDPTPLGGVSEAPKPDTKKANGDGSVQPKPGLRSVLTGLFRKPA